MTEHSNRNDHLSAVNGGRAHGQGILRTGNDGDVLRPKFEVLLSDSLFGSVSDVKVRRVVEDTGWEEMHAADLARIFESREEKTGRRRRRGGKDGEWVASSV